MKLQYTTDCALKVMVYLAGEDRIVSSRELEEKIGFSQQCIFSAGRKLKKAGYVNTISGPFGGYILSKPPGEITMQEILIDLGDAFYINDAASGKASTTALQNYFKKLIKIKNEIDQQMSFALADLI